MTDSNEPNETPAVNPLAQEAEQTPLAPPGDDASTVWLVAFSDDDDRELRASQIAEALRLGEIHADTIVWREGAAEWLPLARVPELAKLLPSSGETATAPLVVPNPALLRRAAKPAPGAAGAAELSRPKVTAPTVGTGAKPSAQSVATKPSMPGVAGKPSVAGRPIPAAKGGTKLGLPKIDPAKKPDATPLPKPKPSPKPEAAASPPAASVTPTSVRTGMKNIWGPSPEEEEAPISIDPESIRPPSPAPARAMQRAKALSPGTLGIQKKKPPTPPRPPEKKAPEPELTSDPGTPSLAKLAAPAHDALRPKQDDELVSLGKSGTAAPEMGPPTIDVSALTAEAPPEPPNAESADPHAVTPTESSASIPTPTEAIAPAPAAREEAREPGSEGFPRAPSTPKKNPWPAVAAAAAVVGLAWFFTHGKKPPEAPQAELETNTPARTAAPDPMSAPAEPALGPTAQPAQAAEPASPAGSATAPEPNTVATPQSTEKRSASAAVPSPKADTGAAPKEKKSGEAPESKPAEPRTSEAKPAETKPAAPEPKEVAVGGDFDKSAASEALGAAAAEASGCRKEGDPSGVAIVHVTFSNTGHATRAVIEGPPFAGTATGGCIASTLRKATVPPYGGDRVTVTKKVVIH